MSNRTNETIRLYAEKLIAAHESGQPADVGLAELETLSRDEATSIQHEVARALSAPVAGWKVAALSDGDLVSAPIVRSRLLTSASRLGPALYGLGGVECEIAFQFARAPLSGRDGFGRDNIVEAVEGVCAAIEVVHSRWSTAFSTPRNAMVADLLSNGALIVGSLSRNWHEETFRSLGARLSVNGQTIRETRGGHPDGDLVGLMVLLANHLRKRGVMINAGDIVTTGSFTGFYTAKAGDEIVAEFDGFSPVSVKFENIEGRGEVYALR